MASLIAQRVPAAWVFGAPKGKAGQIVKTHCPAWEKPNPPPVLEMPAAWAALAAPRGYIGPLMAQALLACGAGASFDNGRLVIGNSALIGAAGKVFAFSSLGAANSWVMISTARAVREVELAGAMAPEARAVWLAGKRAALEKAASNRINAAARVSDPAIVAALIADADFALRKWEHYA
jgi:hypothetical protein